MAAVARAAARAAAARVAARAAVARAAAVTAVASEHAASVQLVHCPVQLFTAVCTRHRASSSSFTSKKGSDMPAEPAALAYRAHGGMVGL